MNDNEVSDKVKFIKYCKANDIKPPSNPGKRAAFDEFRKAWYVMQLALEALEGGEA